MQAVLASAKIILAVNVGADTMKPLSNMIRDTYKKIDSGNSNFCSTPLANPGKLTAKVAMTLLLGQGNADELLRSAGSEAKAKNKKPLD